MKLFKFLAMMLMAVTFSLSMTACGDDEDGTESGGGNNQDSYATVTYTVSTSKLEITIESVASKSVETATFSNEKCTSWKTVITYSSAELADKAWKEIEHQLAELGADIYSKNGNSILCDQGAIAGLEYMTYDIVKQSFDAQVAQYEKREGIKVIRK